MFTTQINIPQQDRAQLADLLNQQLADLSDLSSQTKQAHWNVRGRHFYAQHKLFEELAHTVEAHIDELAERITALGAYAKGSVRHAAQASRLPDFPAEQGDDLGFVDVLGGRFAVCANNLRQAIIAAEELSDSTTADLLTTISHGLDKSLWMLEAHLRPVRGYGGSDEPGRDSDSDRAAAPERSRPRRSHATPRAQRAPQKRAAASPRKRR